MFTLNSDFTETLLLFVCECRYHMDPSGTFVQCDARAIGSASEGAQSSLQEVYHKVQQLHIYIYLESKRKIKKYKAHKLKSCVFSLCPPHCLTCSL